MTIGKPISGWILQRVFHGVGHLGTGNLEADFLHGVAEQLAILGRVDGLPGRADQFDVEFCEHALAHQVESAIQGRLSAHRRQQGIRFLALDDARDGFPGNRLDVDGVSEFRVGHDRRRDSN